MSQNEIRAREAVERALENIVPVGAKIADEQFLCDMGMDSLDKVEIIMELEDHLDICIDENKVGETQNVDVAELIRICVEELDKKQ